MVYSRISGLFSDLYPDQGFILGFIPGSVVFYPDQWFFTRISGFIPGLEVYSRVSGHLSGLEVYSRVSGHLSGFVVFTR